jgi:autotransporter translocation and assembly factor TamB
MPKLPRAFVWSIRGVAALLAAVTALILFLLTTQPGAALVVRYLGGKFPVDLAVGTVSGRLVGPLELGNVRLLVSGVALEFEHLAITWRPSELVNGRRVHLEAVRIDGLRIVAPGEDSEDVTRDPTPPADVATFSPDSISLPIEIVFDDVRVSDASVSVPGLLELRRVDLQAHGTVDSYQADLTAVADPLDFPGTRIEASGTGNLNSFALESFRSNPLRGELRARGSVSWKPDLAWQLSLEADTLAPADLASNPADWPGRLSLTGSARGGVTDRQVFVRIDVDTLRGVLRGQPISGRLSGAIAGPAYELERADFDWGRIRIDAAGDISRQRLALDFELEAPDLSAALPQASGSISAAGKLAGTPSSPQLDATLRADGLSVGVLRLDSARASIDLDWAAGGQNRAQASVSGLAVANQSVDSAQLELGGTKERHELTVRMVGDRARLALRAAGRMRGTDWRGELTQFSISTERLGHWRTENSVGLLVSSDSVELDELCLLASERSVCLGGSWVADGNWRVVSSLEALPLGLLEPYLPEGWSLSGSLNGKVNGNGAGTRVANVDLDLLAEHAALEYSDEERVDALHSEHASLVIRSGADSLSGEFAIELADTSGVRPGKISGHALLPPIEAFTRGTPSEGPIDALRADSRLSLSFDSVSSSLFDRFLPEATRPAEFRLDAGKLTIRAEPDSLSGDFAFQVADTSGARPGMISGHGLLPPVEAFTQEVRLEGIIDAIQDDWRLFVSVDSFPLSLFDRFLPETARLSGTLDGSIDAQAAPDGELTTQIEVVPQNAVLVRTFKDEVHRSRLVEPFIRMHVDGEGLRGEASLTVALPDSAPHMRLSGTARLPEYTNLGQSLNSQILEARLAGAIDLRLIDALVEHFSGTAGEFIVDLAASGTLGQPEISGQYTISGQTDIPSLGLQLRDIEVAAAASKEGNLDIRGGLSSGEGRLEISGRAPIIPSRENPGRLAIRGDRFLAARSDQITLVASPDLEVLWTGSAVDVTGDVAVPRATVEIIELPETSVRVSNDVVLVGAESQPSRPMDVSADIRLILGNEILFKGFGFTTNIEGTLQLIERPGSGTRGRGELVLREGVYRGYGQNLTIDPGRLLFTGPIDDPGLNVRAYRQATDGTRAGFLIRGTLKSPDLQIWSEPVMSESSALSYVLFGRSSELGSSGEQEQAGSAAAILGGNMLAMSMASQVGLDDARIEAGARQQDAALYAGKYLSPKLYVAYGTGLFEPIQVIRVRYLISRKLTLQTETGSRDSGDLLYRIEH